MSISPEPIVGQEVTLHIEMESKSHAPDTLLMITLPEGVALVNGDLTWQGAIDANHIVAVEITIRVIDEGTWPVYAYAYYQFSPDSRTGFGASKTLHVISGAESATVVDDVDWKRTPIPVIQGGPQTLNAPTPAIVTP